MATGSFHCFKHWLGFNSISRLPCSQPLTKASVMQVACVTQHFLRRDQNNTENTEIGRVILGIHASRVSKCRLCCIKQSDLRELPKCFMGELKSMIVRKSLPNHFLREGILSNAVCRSYPFILSLLCALIGRGLPQTLLKPLPHLLDEDPIGAELPMKRPFSAQAFQAYVRANEINGRVSQEEQLGRKGLKAAVW